MCEGEGGKAQGACGTNEIHLDAGRENAEILRGVGRLTVVYKEKGYWRFFIPSLRT